MDKKYLKQVGLYILTTLVAVGVILYIGYHLFYGLTQKMETEPALVSTVTASVEADVYIFRDETVLAYPASSGSLVAAVSDGERVGVGAVLCRQYDVSAPDTVAKIAGLDVQLELLENMRRQQISVRDAASVESDICDILAEIALAGASGEAGGAASLRASLSSAMNRRALLGGSSADIEAASARLTAEKEALTKQLGRCRASLIASVSGYYYAATDGYEALFTGETALHMTAAEFDALCASAPDESVSAGKIATGVDWYAACRVPETEAAAFTVGNRYSVRFLYNDGRTLEMTLRRMDVDADGALLVFSSDALPADFRFTRSQAVSISVTAHTGLKVPASALRVVDGTTGVYIQSGGVVYFRAVRVIYEDGDSVLLETQPDDDPPKGTSWLSQNDMVITRGRGLSDGRVLR